MRGISDRFDNDIVEFGQRWHTFGGGTSEDIFEQFGLDERDYFQRLRDLMSSPAADRLDEVTRSRIETICSSRLRATKR